MERRDDLGVSQTDLRGFDYKAGGFDGLTRLLDGVRRRALVRLVIFRLSRIDGGLGAEHGRRERGSLSVGAVLCGRELLLCGV